MSSIDCSGQSYNFHYINFSPSTIGQVRGTVDDTTVQGAGTVLEASVQQDAGTVEDATDDAGTVHDADEAVGILLSMSSEPTAPEQPTKKKGPYESDSEGMFLLILCEKFPYKS